MTETLVYGVSGMSCEHCRAAVSEEIGALAGVERVEVDLDARRVTVRGGPLDDEAIRRAIADAGYEVD